MDAINLDAGEAIGAHSDPGLPSDDVGHDAYGRAFATWLTEHEAELAPSLAAYTDFEQTVSAARSLRSLLWESGWGRFGWPTEYGGVGGSSLHRAMLYQELFRHGWGGPTIFEHVEIIAPTLVEYGDPGFVAQVLPSFLDGSESWSQGFSEPDSGSDLASLRTRAVDDGDQWIVSGSKIWSSWSKWARWCLALVRTGAPEDRHRGLTMMAIDLTSPGVHVAPIRQANGTDELAQVFFDDVAVPRRQTVGDIGGGWGVALYLLARERGTLAWLRHGALRQRLLAARDALSPDFDQAVGDFVLHWAAMRATAAGLLRHDSAGDRLGPETAFTKLLMTRAEQQLYDLVRDATGSRVAAPITPEDHLLQRDYLFSRIVTVYGGSQQMQLITVARHILGLQGG